MKTGLVLTIGSLGFMILLMISYYLQEKPSTMGSKLYRLLLWTTFFLVLSEILPSIWFFYIDHSFEFYLLLRIHWFFGIIWFCVAYIYCFCFLKNINTFKIKDLIKNEIRCTIVTISTIIVLVIFFFLPFKTINTEAEFTYIPGLPAYLTFIYGTVVTMFIVLLMNNRKNEVSSRGRKSSLLLLCDLSIITVLQFTFPRTVLFGLGFTIAVYFLYFYIENPDLMMVNSLEKLRNDIEKSNLAKTDFLSNMSHEIRSPMNAIIGFSETILANPDYDPEQTKSDISHIATSGNNLLDIINNILDISKIESGNETLVQKEYSIGNIIIGLKNMIETRLANRPIKFIAEVDSEIPKTIYGDSTKLFQVLLNILTNSMKYTEVGRITLEVTKEIKNNDVTLKFRISDTGYGIKQEDYDKLFEKFSRLNSATTNEIEGTGLGLVITKKYVDLLGGKIWFESDYGVGTTFYVEVTQKIVDSTPIGDIREGIDKSDEIEYLDCSGKKVLVVDDNELNLKVAKKVLEKYKFDIETTTTGKDCVYKIKEGQHYDIIFLDHMMPEMDGIEVVHILKKLADYKIPPIVALTANAITGVREMYLREGFDEYLSKPINKSELNRIINKFFK